MTIHCSANKEDIEKSVLMPGDPLRAKYIAENFLTDVKLVNSVRNMLAYTGKYGDKKVTVFSHGMGMPSMGIYSYELYKFYDVEKIIRIGSCGVYTPDIDLLDTILVDKTYTEGNFAYEWNSNDCHLMQADETLNSKIEEAATKLNIHYTKGNTLCSDCFDGYLDNLEMLLNRLPKDLNLIGAEMEAFALFYIAKYLNKKAACLLTVVDSLAKKQSSTAEEREKSLNNMIKIALESI